LIERSVAVQERAAVVGFAWGRSRLPAAAAATAISFNIDAAHGGDDFIPTSSTCDFRFVHMLHCAAEIAAICLLSLTACALQAASPTVLL
jgi:hypothetical protein